MKSTRAPVSVLIHTLNEEINLPFALENVMGWADQVFVVDSVSTDGTAQVARSFGAELFSRPCTRRGLVEQRNWALETLPFRNEWIFILDADEQLEPALKDEVAIVAATDDQSKDAYWCRFKHIFLGRWIKYAGSYPLYSLRLVRRGVRYERRSVNAYPIIEQGRDGYLRNDIIHADRRGVSAYVRRLDEFSTLEATQYAKVRQRQPEDGVVAASLRGSAAQRRRFLKQFFIRMPMRPALIFMYLYFFKRGFLDGRVGFDYSVYKAVGEWLVGVKMREQARLAAESVPRPARLLSESVEVGH